MAPKKEFPGILIKRGKIWHYQVYVPGRGLWKRTTGKANYREAEAEARKLHAQALLLSGSPEESLTLSKAIVREVDRISQSISEARAWRVGVCLENFIRWSGDIQIEKITTEMLARYQAYRASCMKKINVGIGEKKRRVEAKSGTRIATSTTVLEVQYVIRMLRENCLLVQKPTLPRDRQKRPGRPFTKDELKRFFTACNAYPTENPGRYAPLFLLLLCTGARPAELVPSHRSGHTALLKREIDYDTGTVTIRSAKVRLGGRVKITRIQVPPEVLERVQTVAKGNPGAHVFSPMTLHCVFNRILAKAKISPVDELGEKLTAHSFRHTFGTMLAEQGANAFVIQNALRHADLKMTSRYVERATMATEINVSEFLNQEGKNAK